MTQQLREPGAFPEGLGFDSQYPRGDKTSCAASPKGSGPLEPSLVLGIHVVQGWTFKQNTHTHKV